MYVIGDIKERFLRFVMADLPIREACLQVFDRVICLVAYWKMMLLKMSMYDFPNRNAIFPKPIDAISSYYYRISGHAGQIHN